MAIGEGISSVGGTIKTASAVVGNVVSMSLPSMTVSDVDVTELSDTIKKFKAGIVDLGEVTVGLRYKQANASTVLGYITGRTVTVWTITFSDSTTLAFSAYPNGLSGAVPAGDGSESVTQELSLKLTGDSTPAFAAAAG